MNATVELLRQQIQLAHHSLGRIGLNEPIPNPGPDWATYAGEIACLKGLQGVKGYPFQR